jgi:hypothetical protein
MLTLLPLASRSIPLHPPPPAPLLNRYGAILKELRNRHLRRSKAQCAVIKSQPPLQTAQITGGITVGAGSVGFGGDYYPDQPSVPGGVMGGGVGNDFGGLNAFQDDDPDGLAGFLDDGMLEEAGFMGGGGGGSGRGQSSGRGGSTILPPARNADSGGGWRGGKGGKGSRGNKGNKGHSRWSHASGGDGGGWEEKKRGPGRPRLSDKARGSANKRRKGSSNKRMNGLSGGNSGGDHGGFVSLDALDEEGDGGNAYGGNGAYVDERVIYTTECSEYSVLTRLICLHTEV